VSAEAYRAAVRSGSDLQFVCLDCKVGTPSPNISFDVADISFRRDGSGVEETLTGTAVDGVEDELPDDEEDDKPLTFELIQNGTSRSREKLVDSEGYGYTVKRRYVNFSLLQHMWLVIKLHRDNFLTVHTQTRQTCS